MGDYTELAINTVITENLAKKDTIALLEKMFGDGDEPTLADVPARHVGHPFFSTERWDWCVRSGGSAYFKSEPARLFRAIGSGRYQLLLWTNIKNYSDEWGHFLRWLTPMIPSRPWPDHIGHMRFEYREFPTMLYIRSGVLYQVVPGNSAGGTLHELLDATDRETATKKNQENGTLPLADHAAPE